MLMDDDDVLASKEEVVYVRADAGFSADGVCFDDLFCQFALRNPC